MALFCGKLFSRHSLTNEVMIIYASYIINIHLIRACKLYGRYRWYPSRNLALSSEVWSKSITRGNSDVSAHGGAFGAYRSVPGRHSCEMPALQSLGEFALVNYGARSKYRGGPFDSSASPAPRRAARRDASYAVRPCRVARRTPARLFVPDPDKIQSALTRCVFPNTTPPQPTTQTNNKSEGLRIK